VCPTRVQAVQLSEDQGALAPSSEPRRAKACVSWAPADSWVACSSPAPRAQAPQGSAGEEEDTHRGTTTLRCAEEDECLSPRRAAPAAARELLQPPPVACVRRQRSAGPCKARLGGAPSAQTASCYSPPPCDNCGATESPQWRKGPPGKPRLCNACGARYLRTRTLEGSASAAQNQDAPHRIAARRVSVSSRRTDADGDAPPASPPAAPRPTGAAAASAPPVFSPGGAADVLLMLLAASGCDDERERAPAAVTTVPAEPSRRRSAAAASLQLDMTLGAPSAKRRTCEAEADEEGCGAATPAPPSSRGRVARPTRPWSTSISEDDAPPPPQQQQQAARPKAHRPWSLAEVYALVGGVEHFGRGQWADVKQLAAGDVATTLASRSSVDLKDKWRNLARVAALGGDGEAPLRRREAADALPAELLARVRSLCAPAPAAAPQAPKAAAATSPPREELTVTAPGALARRSKHHCPWTADESAALVEGVARAEGCRWTVIKALPLPQLAARTAMDLKDKWRNLLALAQLPSSSRRKQDVDGTLLARVLELEESYGVARRQGRRGGRGCTV